MAEAGTFRVPYRARGRQERAPGGKGVKGGGRGGRGGETGERGDEGRMRMRGKIEKESGVEKKEGENE